MVLRASALRLLRGRTRLRLRVEVVPKAPGSPQITVQPARPATTRPRARSLLTRFPRLIRTVVAMATSARPRVRWATNPIPTYPAAGALRHRAAGAASVRRIPYLNSGRCQGPGVSGCGGCDRSAGARPYLGPRPLGPVTRWLMGRPAGDDSGRSVFCGAPPRWGGTRDPCGSWPEALWASFVM